MIALLSSLIWVGWGGFALSKLWGWYLVPLGVPSLLWWHAGGLLGLHTLLSGGATAYAYIGAVKAMDIESKHSKWVMLIMSVMLPATVLFWGWLVKTLGPIVDAAL